MRFLAVCCLLLLTLIRFSSAQTYRPIIEPAICPIKTDSRLLVKYGYLVVPENRKLPKGRKVKVPFLFVRKPDQQAQHHVFLYTTGGPGYSTIANIDSIGYDSGLLKFGALVLFDQRGTKHAKPCLDCMETAEVFKRSYMEGLNKDSLMLVAINKCRDRLLAQGIDLSSYNTIESAEDINDLRLALQLDSLNLAGISYSGGLMLTMVRNHPEGVRSLMLNSPLPGNVRYEEDGLLNINEALEQVFINCESDSANNPLYKNLRERFHDYFTAINGQRFKLKYWSKYTHDTITIAYSKNELLDAIVNRLNSNQVKSVPLVINDIINGEQNNYVREVIDGNFSGDQRVSLGMRYSVYCTEQIAYSNPTSIKQQDSILPWLANYPFNDVNNAVCNCWKANPEPPIVKTPVYSKIPALITSGDIDPWCRPFYNKLIKRYLPNAQLLILHNKGHAPGFTVDGVDYAQQFVSDPYKKLVSQSDNLIIE